MTAARTDRALAQRLVTRVFDTPAERSGAPKKKTEGRIKRAMSEPVTAEIRPQSSSEPKPRARPQLRPVEPAPAPTPYVTGYELAGEMLGKAREMAQQTALQLADLGLYQSQTAIGLQEILLKMAQANLEASVAATQRLLAATTLDQALGAHRRFAQDQVTALTGQAAQLRLAAARLTGETAEPWAEYWSKSFARIRGAFGV